MIVTIQPIDCWMGQTLNCWHSVDAYHSDLLTVIGCLINVPNIPIVIIASQHNVSIYIHLHSKASRPLSFWSTTIHVIWMINDVILPCFSAFGQLFTTWKCSYWFEIYIVWLSHHSLSSTFSSISKMYHMQFSKSWPCASGLSGELRSWMHGLMQHNGSHSSRFRLGIDCSFDASYDITDLNRLVYFVSYLGFAFKFKCNG
jgi:hypothetical protein